MEAAGKLTQATAPDIFIAEPVGSCTDLVATVTYPLRRLYGDPLTIAPLGVLVVRPRHADVGSLRQSLHLQGGVHLPKKQLEEADIIVLSKSDLITADQEKDLRDVLSRNFPGRSYGRFRSVTARDWTSGSSWWRTPNIPRAS